MGKLKTPELEKVERATNVPGERERPKLTREEEQLMQSFLLQEHCALIWRSSMLSLLYRVVFLSAIACIIFLETGMIIQRVLLFPVLCGVANIWLMESRTIRNRLATLGEAFARTSPDGWEDAYIRSRFYPHDHISRVVLRAEPIMWLLIASTIELLVIVLPKLLAVQTTQGTGSY